MISRYEYPQLYLTLVLDMIFLSQRMILIYEKVAAKYPNLTEECGENIVSDKQHLEYYAVELERMNALFSQEA